MALHSHRLALLLLLGAALLVGLSVLATSLLPAPLHSSAGSRPALACASDWLGDATLAWGATGGAGRPPGRVGAAPGGRCAELSARRSIREQVWAWGSNDSGQLGDGSVIDRPTPTLVTSTNEGNQRLSIGGSHVLANHPDGSVWSWGWNLYGQLGDGTHEGRAEPGRVPVPAQVVAVAAGHDHSLALAADGAVWAWGGNHYGQLGDGGWRDQTQPVRVRGLPGNVIEIVAGGYHSLALDSDGGAWTWGKNAFGQLGIGEAGNPPASAQPRPIPGLTGVSTLAAGFEQSYALLADGTLRAWGANEFGQLGDGTTTGRSEPVEVSGLSRVRAFAAGGSHALALDANGAVWAWGENNFGQLGSDEGPASLLPVRMPGLVGAVQVAAGDFHSLALDRDGVVWAWGINSSGQLGNLAADSSSGPIQASGLTGVAAIAAGGSQSLAVRRSPFFERTDDSAGGVVYSGSWRHRPIGQASGGTVAISDPNDPGEAAFSWTGTGLVVLMVRGPHAGMAWIQVDDADSYLVDLYSPLLQYQQPVLVLDRLREGRHQVVVAPGGERNQRSGGETIALDAFDTR